MAKNDHIAQVELLPIISHEVNSTPINQRATDGYVNGTALCQACDKQLKHYLENAGTKAFLEELSRSVGIPTDLLVHKITTGANENRGSWVHPQVAINLGQWASPQFAVLVSKWVFEWMSGSSTSYPYHIRRYLVNRHKIPATHFSMLDQVTIKLLGALESQGYIVPQNMMVDISLGKAFSKWLRNNGHDPDSFPSYTHSFDDGKRPEVQARLYPNELMTEFNIELETWIKDGRAMKYFSERDQNSIPALKAVYAKLPNVEQKQQLR
jgi:hypothetical protein